MKKNEVIHYENGKRVERIFYRSGELMCEIIFENGKKQGVEKIYDKNGNVIKETLPKYTFNIHKTTQITNFKAH